MKFSTIMAVSAIALAVVSAGCKYDKAAMGGDGAADGSDVAALADGTDINGSAIDTQNMADRQDGDLASVAGGNFEDMYKKCTDVSFAPVYFGFDSTVVPQGELGKIDDVAQHLAQHSDRVVVVEGHCDERGSNEYNLSLGENRAVIVRNYLVQSGVTEDRIQTRSYGEERPAVAGHDESAWAHNRRGEFGIYQK